MTKNGWFQMAKSAKTEKQRKETNPLKINKNSHFFVFTPPDSVEFG
jgi:hypothetical protein